MQSDTLQIKDPCLLPGNYKGVKNQGQIKRVGCRQRAEIGGLTLCGHLRQKECTKPCKLSGFEYYILYLLLMGMCPIRGGDEMSPQVTKFCESFIWSAPSFFINSGSAYENISTFDY